MLAAGAGGGGGQGGLTDVRRLGSDVRTGGSAPWQCPVEGGPGRGRGSAAAPRQGQGPASKVQDGGWWAVAGAAGKDGGWLSDGCRSDGYRVPS